MNANLGSKAVDKFKDDDLEPAHKCWRSSNRGMCQGVVLEFENGNREGIFYTAILGMVSYNPSKGITFSAECNGAVVTVDIDGNNLESLHRDLTLGRCERIGLGEAVTAIQALCEPQG